MMKKFKILLVTFILGSLMTFTSYSYKAFIFDVDGVLVDTEGLKFNAWNKALNHFKLQPITLDQYKNGMVGNSSKIIAAKIQDLLKVSFDITQLIHYKDLQYQELQKETIIPIVEGVSFLKEALTYKMDHPDFKVAIASSGSRKEILRNLNSISVDSNQFDEILSGHDDLKHINDPMGTNKPKPYIYRLCLEKLQLSSVDCLVFEDSEAGVVAAADAGIPVYAIPNKYTEKNDFSRATQITEFKNLNIKDLISIKF